MLHRFYLLLLHFLFFLAHYQWEVEKNKNVLFGPLAENSKNVLFFIPFVQCLAHKVTYEIFYIFLIFDFFPKIRIS